MVAKPGISGGANWPPSAYDAASRLLLSSARGDRASTFRAWEIEPDASAGRRAVHRRQLRQQPAAAAGHVRRARHAHEQARVAAALGEHLLQRLDRHGGRPRVRRPQRRPAHRARFARRHEALGVPDGRRHELDRQRVRAKRASSTSSRIPPAAVFAGSSNGDSVWLFALDGTLEPASAARQVTDRFSRGHKNGIRPVKKGQHEIARGYLPARLARSQRSARMPNRSSAPPAFAAMRSRCTAYRGLADERRRLVQPPLFAAARNRSRQRREAQGRLAQPPATARASAHSTRAKRSRSSTTA